MWTNYQPASKQWFLLKTCEKEGKPNKFSTSQNGLVMRVFKKLSVFHICGKLVLNTGELHVENHFIF